MAAEPNASEASKGADLPRGQDRSVFDPAIAHYAVIGHPIAHSKSPAIHTAFAAAYQQAMHYDRIDAPVDAFAETVRRFIARGGRGLNVTVPFKLEAFALAETLTERAAAAGAVNTLRFYDDHGVTRIEGDNTDGAGLVTDLVRNLNCPIAGRRVLLLGAGGAARGTILPLLKQRPARLHVVNRTAARALELQARFAGEARLMGVALTASAAPETDDRVDAGHADGAFDIVINATSGSLSGALPTHDARAIGPATLVYDMMYGVEPTIFMQYAAALGATVHDGLGMLVEQAAESFAVWRGVHPDGRPVLQQLRADMLSETGVRG